MTTIIILAFTVRFFPITNATAAMGTLRPEMEAVARIRGCEWPQPIAGITAFLPRKSLFGGWAPWSLPA